jgi:hypothetical protein
MVTIHCTLRVQNWSTKARGVTLAGVIALLLGCAGQPSMHGNATAGLPLGLYAVTARSCENPGEMADDCPLIRYVELVKGTFFGVTPEQTALVLWLASGASNAGFTYGAGPMRGHFVSREEYVVNEYPDAREWLRLDRGAVLEYGLIIFRTAERKTVLKRTRLTLKRVERTPEINRQMPYPDPQ